MCEGTRLWRLEWSPAPRKEQLVPAYMVLWKANANAWPAEPKQILSVLEGATAGADMLLKSGTLRELGWFTAEEGYAIMEADSKVAVLAMVQPFFPFYSPDIREIVSWDAGKSAVLESARQAANR